MAIVALGDVPVDGVFYDVDDFVVVIGYALESELVQHAVEFVECLAVNIVFTDDSAAESHLLYVKSEVAQCICYSGDAMAADHVFDFYLHSHFAGKSKKTKRRPDIGADACYV